MAMSVELHNTRDPAVGREAQALVEHTLSDRAADWRVSIVGCAYDLDRALAQAVAVGAFRGGCGSARRRRAETFRRRMVRVENREDAVLGESKTAYPKKPSAGSKAIYLRMRTYPKRG